MKLGQTPVFRGDMSGQQSSQVSMQTDRLVARMSLGQGSDDQSEASLMRYLTTDLKGKMHTHRRTMESAGSRYSDSSAVVRDMEERLEKLTANLSAKDAEMY